MKRVLNILLVVLSATGFAWGQKSDSASTPSQSTIGLELDALPYITGGYYGSIWYGIDHVRFRGVITKTTVPEFVLPEGYRNNHLNVLAFIVDYFPQRDFRGWWIGTGIEFWNATIEQESESVSPSYSNTIFTVGGGYVWKFFKNFYLNPWAAGHLLVAGTKEVPVGSRIYKPATFTGEVSLKIGWHL